MEELHISDVATDFLEPHLAEDVALNPLADKKTQASVLVGQEHVAGFMRAVLLVINLRNVRKSAQTKPFGEVTRPDGFERLFSLNLINKKCGRSGKENPFCTDGPDVQNGFISGLRFFHNFFLGQNVVNSELELDRLELSHLVHNIVVVAHSYKMVIEPCVDDHFFALWVL
jgi:hypothetical protein